MRSRSSDCGIVAERKREREMDGGDETSGGSFSLNTHPNIQQPIIHDSICKSSDSDHKNA